MKEKLEPFFGSLDTVKRALRRKRNSQKQRKKKQLFSSISLKNRAIPKFTMKIHTIFHL